jgi:hypothetical protein
VALKGEQEDWIIVSAREDRAIAPAPFDQVVGVVGGQLGFSLALVVLEADGRTLSLVGLDASGQTARRQVHTAAAPIQHVTLSAAVPNLAYSTVGGDVVVYSLHDEKPLCRFTPRGVAS